MQGPPVMRGRRVEDHRMRQTCPGQHQRWNSDCDRSQPCRVMRSPTFRAASLTSRSTAVVRVGDHAAQDATMVSADRRRR